MIAITEEEIKYQVSEKDFYKLKDYLDSQNKGIDIIHQCNYYFDTNSLFLKNNGVSVRLRNINDSECEFTIKIKSGDKNSNLHRCKEYTEKIMPEDFTAILESKSLYGNSKVYGIVKEILSDKDLKENINLIGSLATERSVYDLAEEKYKLLLDKNCFLDYQDFEIECETDDALCANKIINDIFIEIDIKPINNFDSKSARFMKRLKDYMDKPMKGGE